MSFWDVVWFIFISFAFVAYLIVMFSIITDLFRDRDTSGWVKALWIVLLIFFPLITALVYLIVHGSAMTERSVKSAETMKQQQDAYIREVAGQPASPVDQVAKAKDMLDSGAISKEEFDALKAKALAA
ncbi:MAG TPA: SHOCT domain-containing protein [Nocardioidaceae bacterium]|nr:SHOCT domain-containing protein [Nocardioidaceae bacterium]